MYLLNKKQALDTLIDDANDIAQENMSKTSNLYFKSQKNNNVKSLKKENKKDNNLVIELGEQIKKIDAFSRLSSNTKFCDGDGFSVRPAEFLSLNQNDIKTLKKLSKASKYTNQIFYHLNHPKFYCKKAKDYINKVLKENHIKDEKLRNYLLPLVRIVDGKVRQGDLTKFTASLFYKNISPTDTFEILVELSNRIDLVLGQQDIEKYAFGGM